MKRIIKTIYYLRRFYDINDVLNGLYENRYTFKQKNDNYLHVTIYKERGELTLISKKAHMNGIFTRESLIKFLSNDLYHADKMKTIECINCLSKTDKKFLNFFSIKYKKFMSELPTVIVSNVIL